MTHHTNNITPLTDNRQQNKNRPSNDRPQQTVPLRRSEGDDPHRPSPKREKSRRPSKDDHNDNHGDDPQHKQRPPKKTVAPRKGHTTAPSSQRNNPTKSRPPPPKPPTPTPFSSDELLQREQERASVMKATHNAGDQDDPFAQVDLSKRRKKTVKRGGLFSTLLCLNCGGETQAERDFKNRDHYNNRRPPPPLPPSLQPQASVRPRPQQAPPTKRMNPQPSQRNVYVCRCVYELPSLLSPKQWPTLFVGGTHFDKHMDLCLVVHFYYIIPMSCVYCITHLIVFFCSFLPIIVFFELIHFAVYSYNHLFLFYWEPF
jgi:hypothetical protein